MAKSKLQAGKKKLSKDSQAAKGDALRRADFDKSLEARVGFPTNGGRAEGTRVG
jgi:hypothetical protein